MWQHDVLHTRQGCNRVFQPTDLLLNCRFLSSLRVCVTLKTDQRCAGSQASKGCIGRNACALKSRQCAQMGMAGPLAGGLGYPNCRLRISTPVHVYDHRGYNNSRSEQD